MNSDSMHESRLIALKLRLVCYYSACENARLARLAAHTWRHLWFFSGHPNFRTGALCYLPPGGLRLACKANLDDPGLCAILTCEAQIWQLKYVFPDARDFRKLPITLAMECILCGDHDRLGDLDVALLRKEVSCKGQSVNAFQYAAALGRLECFDILINKLGVASPLLVGPDGKLSSGVLACCGARFPFGRREGVLHLLLSRLSWDSFRPEPLLESASFSGVPWMLSFVFSRFAEAGKKGIAAAVDLGPCLVAASENGHPECARLLMEHGADANAKNRYRETVLTKASQNGHTDCARLLLEHGADVNAKNQYATTALMWVSQNGHTDCARLLLEHGADANAKDQYATTALMKAYQNGHTDCVRLLLEHGADANAKDQYGETALIWASRNGHTDCARLLLEHGADVNAMDRYGETVLMKAYQNGRTDCVRLLLEHGEDVNAKNQYATTALMRVSQDGHTDCARLLLEHGADVNAKNHVGQTALMWASLNGHTDCVRLLLEHGADANAKDQYGETALMWASRNLNRRTASRNCTRLLLEHGASRVVSGNPRKEKTRVFNKKLSKNS